MKKILFLAILLTGVLTSKAQDSSKYSFLEKTQAYVVNNQEVFVTSPVEIEIAEFVTKQGKRIIIRDQISSYLTIPKEIPKNGFIYYFNYKDYGGFGGDVILHDTKNTYWRRFTTCLSKDPFVYLQIPNR